MRAIFIFRLDRIIEARIFGWCDLLTLVESQSEHHYARETRSFNKACNVAAK